MGHFYIENRFANDATLLHVPVTGCPVEQNLVRGSRSHHSEVFCYSHMPSGELQELHLPNYRGNAQ